MEYTEQNKETGPLKIKGFRPWMSILCLGTAPLWSDQLILPEAFNILKVNGQKHNVSLLSKERKVELEAGPQRILLQYVDFYDIDHDDHEKVVSKPFLLKFKHEGGGNITTDFVRPEFLKIARLFASNPEIKLVDANGKRIPAELAAPRETGKTQTMIAKKQNTELKDRSKINEEPHLKQAKDGPLKNRPHKAEMKALKKKRQENKQSAQTLDSRSPLEQLEHWWTKASFDEKQSFLKKILN